MIKEDERQMTDDGDGRGGITRVRRSLWLRIFTPRYLARNAAEGRK